MLQLQSCQITWFIITLIIFNRFTYYCLDLINMAKKINQTESLLIFYCMYQKHNLITHRLIFTLFS